MKIRYRYALLIQCGLALIFQVSCVTSSSRDLCRNPSGQDSNVNKGSSCAAQLTGGMTSKTPPLPTKTLVANRHLEFAKRHKIKHEIYRVDLHLPDLPDDANFTYSVEFPALTQNQFQMLNQRFGGQTLKKWKPATRFELMDFLPARIQALANHTLNQVYIKTEMPPSWRDPSGKTPEPEIEVTMTCWDAAYEVARVPMTSGSTKEGRLFHLGINQVEASLKNPQHFDQSAQQVLAYESILPGPTGFKDRNANRKLGDVLLINTFVDRGLGVSHAMVWLDDDFYFEKTDGGSSDPFRLVFYEDGIKPWVTDISTEVGNRPYLVFTYNRYSRGLPDPLSFTGKGFYYNWATGTYPAGTEPKDPLPPTLANRLIWNFDVGLGSGPSKIRINPVAATNIADDGSGRYSAKVSDPDFTLRRRF